MSRPSSRLSGLGAASDQQHARNSNSNSNRPASSSSGREREREREQRSVSSSSSHATILARPQSSMSTNNAHARVPFTPGANTKIANLGLSARQVDKLSKSIAEIQRGPSSTGQPVQKVAALQYNPASRPVAQDPGRKTDQQDRKGKARGTVTVLHCIYSKNIWTQADR